MNSVTQQPSTPDYLNTLGLQRAPFLDKIDDHFFYADPVLVQRLDLLQHLTRFGDMLLGVSGPNGSGKTTLLQQFLLRGNNSWRSCLVQGGQIKHPGELLARIAECLGLDMLATPERLKADLIRYCQALQHNSQLAVVVIDDAHLLPESALNALLELGGDARQTLKLLRVLLFSEPGLEQKLTASGLHSPQQPLLHSLEIPRFDEQQSAAYLMYRLAVAGFSGDSPFSLTEIRALHKSAEGLPGKLNVLAHETLIERASRLAARKKTAAAKPSPAPVAPQRRHRTLAALGIVLLLGAAGLYLAQTALLEDWLEDLEPNLELTLAPTTPEPVAAPPSEAPAPAATEDEPKEILGQTPENPQPADPMESISTAPVPTLTGAPPASAVETVPPATTPTGGGPASPDATATPASSPAPEPTREPEAPEPKPTPAPAADAAVPAAEPAEAGETTEPAATPAEQPAAAPPHAESPLSSPAAVASAASPAKDEVKADAPAPTPAPATDEATPEPPAAASATRPGKPAPAGILREDWLQTRPAEHFTLQLLGVRSETSLQEYLKHNRPPGPVAYFRTQYKGGDWYVLVQGDYPSMTAARAAIATLPTAVRKAKPWPRTFATVQADIHKTAP